MFDGPNQTCSPPLLRHEIHESYRWSRFDSIGQPIGHAQYTRMLLLKENYILWNHVYAVYQRESKSHLYVTDLRKAHVTIDSLSKMRVKLAVQTLSEKVEKEMKECNKEATEETRNYILACATFWNVFNDPTPIGTGTDQRITQLNDVLKYFDLAGSGCHKSSKTKQIKHNILSLGK